jgi:hypothetical protein
MESKVKGPALGLIILGGIGVVLGLWGLIFGGGAPEDVDPQLREFAESIEKFSRGLGVLNILASAFLVWSGLQMKALEGWGVSLAGCILVMTPLAGCTCVIGLPIGIWGLIVLFNAEVKAAFEAGQA